LSLRGVLVPLATPLTECGEVSTTCVGALIDSVRRYAGGLLPGLSTGEGWCLSKQQWIDMLVATVEHARDLPVIAGVLLADATKIVERLRDVGECLHAVAVAPPFDRAANQEDIYAHFRVLRSATTTPILIYNESRLSGAKMNVKTIRRVCELGHVAAIKDSSGRIDVSRELAATTGVPVFQGSEHLLTDSAALAGSAVALANLEPRLCAAAQRKYTAATAGAVAHAIRRYGLDGPDWYAHVKRELVRRKVIRASAIVSEDRR
jgi:4-hydroxy-tetrahydrodipicolinate synthase